MKKLGNLFVVLGLVMALIVGFLIGISVEYPRTNNRALSGTIGKVSNYRKVQITEADIQLKNELAADTSKLKILRGYFNFYYVGALKMSFNADMAVKESVAVSAFYNANKSLIAGVESYGKYLLSARTDLLLTLSACSSVTDADPIQLRNILNQGRNVVAQINYRDRVVLDFVKELSGFIMMDKKGKYKGLEQVHDLLVANEIFTSVVTKNKVALKFLDKTKLLSRSQQDLNAMDQQKLGMMIQQDVEKLSHWSVAGDAEKLKLTDDEKLKSTDSEKLDHFTPFLDVQKLSSIAGDAERLGVSLTKDVEKLACDAEKLGIFDTEKLGGFRDNESLGINVFFTFDSEKLGIIMDSEALRGFDPIGQVFNPPPRPIGPF